MKTDYTQTDLELILMMDHGFGHCANTGVLSKRWPSYGLVRVIPDRLVLTVGGGSDSFIIRCRTPAEVLDKINKFYVFLGD